MTKPIVLVVGISGTLGKKIATAIIQKGEMDVRGFVRPGTLDDERKKQKLADLIALGVSFTEGTLFDSESLEKACSGVEVVVSGVKGVRDDDESEIIISGQSNLMEAAIKSGVKRFVPSDYAVDIFKIAWGDNYNLNLRRAFAERLINSNLGYTIVLNGAFTEVQFSPWGKLFDFDKGIFSYWGDGETPCDLTTMDDTAKYLAEAIADPAMENQVMRVAGDVITMKEILATYEKVSNKKLIEQQLGTVEDLKIWIEKTRTTAKSHFEYLAEQYHYTLVSRKGKLEPLDNRRYPNIKPTTVKEFVSKMSSATTS
ncbi:MAG: NmrA family NAD(P)-binding protein [Scytonematopsis contorta HA4267-MV1]|jgi:uncharacterized protein YbjT (DUF2867 family)|nr:NmrA family NAD(P)-binding protein [Scytonematopsis contorta HA4267-MV1]